MKFNTNSVNTEGAAPSMMWDHVHVLLASRGWLLYFCHVCIISLHWPLCCMHVWCLLSRKLYILP